MSSKLWIPYTRYREACKVWNDQPIRRTQRFGQFLVNEMGLHKSVQDRAWVDRLYEAGPLEAGKMILEVIDYGN